MHKHITSTVQYIFILMAAGLYATSCPSLMDESRAPPPQRLMSEAKQRDIIEHSVSLTGKKAGSTFYYRKGKTLNSVKHDYSPIHKRDTLYKSFIILPP